MMSSQEISSKVKELRELKRMQAELADEIAALEDAIKAHMDAAGMDTLTTADAKVRWATYTSSRLDAAALRQELPDVAARYMKTVTARRFSIN